MICRRQVGINVYTFKKICVLRRTDKAAKGCGAVVVYDAFDFGIARDGARNPCRLWSI